ncbi:MAG TPA: AAA family ATPase, partial [Gammaproteobacteria bacterium]|nr:AAA family ATPase [Gammaproteobacteria bacterium]
MLTYIHIRALAVVEELELELGGAMSALTGETGAGKSILVDALGLVLGDRADSDVIRHGADRAEVSASFDLTDLPAARAWLQAQELDADGECQLRRVVTREGRSRGYINARPVPIQSLRELGQHLVDIHGQHEHQSLLRRDVQRQLLDDVGGHGEALEQTTAAYADWKRLHGELETLRSAERDRSDRLDLLRFQVRELEALALDADEWEALESEHTRLAHAGQLLETCQRALDGLYEADEGAAHAMLARAAGDLEPLAEIDPRLHGAWELLNSALIQVREGVDELRGYLDRVDLDPQRLAWVEQRLGDIHQLARKHRCDPPELPALQARLSEELDTLEHADQRLEELEQALE